MSMHAFLMVGVRFSEVYKVEDVTTEVTKYNPDTGEPYQKKIVSQKHYLFGKEITEPGEIGPEDWGKEAKQLLEGLNTENDGSYNNYSDNTYNHFIIGKVLCEIIDLDSCGKIQEIPLQKIKEMKGEVEHLLKEKGYEGEVSIYLVGYSSY